MVRRKLTISERWQAVGMHNGGISHRRVTDNFRVNHSIIVRLMQRFRQTGNVIDRPRAGRPRKTTPREDRYYILIFPLLIFPPGKMSIY
jgi:transposase